MTTAPATAFADGAIRVRAGEDHHAVAGELVATMTLAEKLDCLDGDTDFWPGMADMTSGGYHAHPWPAAAVPRLGVPGIDFVDGPRGSVVGAATCFPVSMARGASFDPDLEERIGEAMGAELRSIGATYTGAVCLNLLRHPGWGRAQETYGEDPHHVGEMAAALTRGLQRHVLACMKHFACNSMENARFRVDVTADERALHEVYLPHFRRVADEGVASTMSAYNALNGEWCGDSPTLLTDILRDEWGWDGFVITDFMFGLRDPVASVLAGCDIEMPFRQQRAHALSDAVADGRLDETDVDRCVTRVVATLLRFSAVFDAAPDRAVLASPAHRALAREASVAGTVLLANDGTLPLDAAALRSVAVLGRLAAVPNLGDGGSSDVYPPEVVTPLDGLREALVGSDGAPGPVVVHADDDASIADDADVTIVVVGTTKADEGEYLDPDGMGDLFALFPPMPAPESTPPPAPGSAAEAAPASAPEPVSAPDGPADNSVAGFTPGGDRRSLRLSDADEALVAAAVDAATGPVVVVVMGGSAFVVPWLDDVSAALQVFYPGMEGGRALADIVLGRAEPGGRLPFAVPVDEADLVHFDPDASTEIYGLLHGQWHLDATGTAAHLPFGHGLGYTTWTVDDLAPDIRTAASTAAASAVTATVANTGSRDGSTVVFVFAAVPDSIHERPERRLVGFGRVHAAAGTRVDVTIPVDWRQLDVRVDGGWVTEAGTYELTATLAATRPSASCTIDRSGA